MGDLLELIKKDIALEARSKESSAVMLCLSMLLSVIAAIGVTLSFLSPDTVARVAPFLIWMIFLFSATSAVGRSLEPELEQRALDGMLLTGVSPALIFLSKVISNALVILLGQIAAIVLLTILLDLTLLSAWWQMLTLSIVVIIGYSSLATLFAGLTSSARLRGLLLPLILLPLLFPLLFGAIEETMTIAVDRAFDPLSVWFTFLCFLDVLYLVLGLNLYGFAVRD